MLDGKVKLDIPAGTQSGTVQKIAGKGIPYLRNDGRGDEYVTIKVVTPKNLTSRQKKLLEQFETYSNSELQQENKSLFSKLKNLANYFYWKYAIS